MDLFAAANALMDLRTAGFSFPESRLLVLERDGGLQVSRVGYETPLEECTPVTQLGVYRTSSEDPGPCSAFASQSQDDLEADRISWEGGVTLTLRGDLLSVGGPQGYVLTFLLDGVPQRFELGLGDVLLDFSGGHPRIERHHRHQEFLASGRALWLDWFARCPRVAAEWQQMVAHCWWVLGINTVRLATEPGRRAVVPSKQGYFALWQWDAYFISCGLRHGDLALAREQLEIALAHARPDGQLPDVVSDAGILASSADLPPAERAGLPDDLPLTKPPLTAWALAKLAGDDGWAAGLLPTVIKSQEWWFTQGDPPVYAHPFSSGLDDSPAFDAGYPLPTPDLLAYLALQDELIAESLPSDAAVQHLQRARHTRQLLHRMWDSTSRRYGTGPATIVELLPLVAGNLPAEIAASIVEALEDPHRFAAEWPVPTASPADPAYSPTRMWRGPTWINTNYLLVEGLRKAGRNEFADRLARRTLELVCHAGGPFEYYNPETGQRPRRAVPAFSWTAALFIDLAVGLTPEEDS